jgi:hypothetical protein
MPQNWADNHPWMTFILGVLSLLTLNTGFVSLGGGYRKPLETRSEDCQCKKKTQEDEEQKIILN